MIRLAGWHEPESEMDFEAIVQRAERIAAGDALDDTDYDVDDEDLFDPYDDEDFKALVRERDRRAAAGVSPRARARRDRRLRRRRGASAPTASTRATRSRRTTSTTGS